MAGFSRNGRKVTLWGNEREERVTYFEVSDGEAGWAAFVLMIMGVIAFGLEQYSSAQAAPIVSQILFGLGILLFIGSIIVRMIPSINAERLASWDRKYGDGGE